MTGPEAAATPWPVAGVLRVHRNPRVLPPAGDGVGPNRFDDPRPRSADRYLMRYAATTLRGCLLELLDWLRPSEAAAAREAAVLDNDPGAPPAAPSAPGRALEVYLAGRRVGRITAAAPLVVAINDPIVQAELDREPAVRALLDGGRARAELLSEQAAASHVVHLDQAVVRLGSELGRDITRACSLALRDRSNWPDVIHYRSRHDDAENCWAIYDHAVVTVDQIHPLSPEDPAHRRALHSVATLWQLALPRSWEPGTS